MKNNKTIKFIFIFFLAISLLFINCMPIYSNAYSSYPANKIEPSDSSESSEKISTLVGAFLNIVRIIAVAVAIIMLLILAIKYMSAAPNDKAEIKKHAVVYVVGAILLFSASGVLGIIQKFAEGNIN